MIQFLSAVYRRRDGGDGALEEKEKASIAATLPFLSAAAAAKISGNREEEPSAHHHHQKHPKLISRRRRPFPSLFLSPQTNRLPLRPRRKFNTCSKSNFASSLTLACLARSTWWETLRELSFNIGRFFCPPPPPPFFPKYRNDGRLLFPFFSFFPTVKVDCTKNNKREKGKRPCFCFSVCVSVYVCVCVCLVRRNKRVASHTYFATSA